MIFCIQQRFLFALEATCSKSCRESCLVWPLVCSRRSVTWNANKRRAKRPLTIFSARCSLRCTPLIEGLGQAMWPVTANKNRLMNQSERKAQTCNWHATFAAFAIGYMFPALGTGYTYMYMFSRTSYPLRVFPRFSLVKCHLVLATRYIFSRALKSSVTLNDCSPVLPWHQLCLLLLSVLSLIAYDDICRSIK